MKLAVDWGLCDGNGICAIEASAFFELDDDDELVVLREEFDADELPTVQRAGRGCPKHAISIEQ